MAKGREHDPTLLVRGLRTLSANRLHTGYCLLGLLTSLFFGGPSAATEGPHFNSSIVVHESPILITDFGEPRPVEFTDGAFLIGQLFTPLGQRILALAIDQDCNTRYEVIQTTHNIAPVLKITTREGNRSIPLPSKISVWLPRYRIFANSGECLFLEQDRMFVLRQDEWRDMGTPYPKGPDWLRRYPRQIALRDGLFICRYDSGEWGSGVIAFDIADEKWRILITQQSIETDNAIQLIIAGEELWGYRRNEVFRYEDGKMKSLGLVQPSSFVNISSIWKSGRSDSAYIMMSDGQLFKHNDNGLSQVNTGKLVKCLQKVRSENKHSATVSRCSLLAVTKDFLIFSDSSAGMVCFDMKTQSLLMPQFTDKQIVIKQ